MPTGKRFNPISWSPDGERCSWRNLPATLIQKIHILNVQTGEITVATPEDGLFSPGPWEADGSGFYFLTSYQREYFGLAFYNMEINKWDWVETPEHDIENVVISKNGMLVWSVNDNGASKLHGRDVRSGRI